MEIPLEIDFQGFDGGPDIRETVEQHVTQLEQRYGRITACRVALKGPGGHHKAGGQYEVNIRIVLPEGREVNVSRTAVADERLSQLPFAISDAFKHARRRLQDAARRMRGQTKKRNAAPVGTVIRLDEGGGFGVIRSPDGEEVYFHRNSVLNDGFSKMKVGTRVTYFEETGDKGPQASTVKLLGKHGLR